MGDVVDRHRPRRDRATAGHPPEQRSDDQADVGRDEQDPERDAELAAPQPRHDREGDGDDGVLDRMDRARAHRPETSAARSFAAASPRWEIAFFSCCGTSAIVRPSSAMTNTGS